MAGRGFPVLAVLTVLAVGAAFYSVQRRAPETELAQSRLFPDLEPALNDVARIEVRDKDHASTLVKTGATWGLEDRGGYPASFEKVKALVLGLAGMEVLEPKTGKQENYAKLGVEGLEAGASASTLVTMSDAQGRALSALIIGKQASGRAAGTYVRKKDDERALLVSGSVSAPADPSEWLEKDLFNIRGERIREILIEVPKEQPLRVYRAAPKDTDFALDPAPQGTRIKSQTIVNSLATALEDLRFDDVKPKAQWTPGEPSVTTLRTFDGLVVKATLDKIEDKTYGQFELGYDAQSVEPEAKKEESGEHPEGKPIEPKDGTDKNTPPGVSPEAEAKQLNAQVSNWVYALPTYKAELLTKTLAALAAPPEEKKRSRWSPKPAKKAQQPAGR
ncbi:MAG: DUF4340 domain-containing protein [Gammaproteobacteria bacterium]